MKDVHAMAPTAGRLDLRRVGVSGIKKPLSIQRPDRVVTISASFSVDVDLPASRKGSDLSRNAELLAEVVDSTATSPVESLESACQAIARELLMRHQYATQAQVEASGTYFRSRGISERRRSFEDYKILAGARATRDSNGGEPELHRIIGGEPVGMTACPCAMETAREILESEIPLLKDPSFAKFPIISHNQRNRTRLLFEVHPGVNIEVDRILDAIEAAQSSPTYAILKRRDEAQVVLDAHRNPKFVEDVMRDLLSGVVGRFADLPDETLVIVETVSEESIHKYDVTASHRMRLGELRQPAPA
ncbi:MAG: GTP cyclohydrolase MptA [Thermoplasmata archaeon]|nr:GTP cyclohydrolase MptA [Thermoplasmata archaeon]